MQEYLNKKELINEINKRAKLFIDEFEKITDESKDTLVEGVDRSPAQMIAYQLGWMKLVLSWEEKEKKGGKVVTPKEGYKWNKLGDLYKSFYEEYKDCSMGKLITEFNISVEKIIDLVESYTEKELFETGARQWASSTSNN